MTRYCIGCVHLDLTPREPGVMGSSWTGQYGQEEAATFCKRNHWRAEMGPEATLETFRACMEKATDCLDYEERETP